MFHNIEYTMKITSDEVYAWIEKVQAYYIIICHTLFPIKTLFSKNLIYDIFDGIDHKKYDQSHQIIKSTNVLRHIGCGY